MSMARKSYLRVAGVIENMSAFTCEHGTTYALFGEGGGAARWPTTPASRCSARCRSSRPCRAGGDAGEPVALGAGPAAEAFRAIADPHRRRGGAAREMAGCSARMLEAAVAALDAADAEEAAAAGTTVPEVAEIGQP